jgi:hypothetical protein
MSLQRISHRVHLVARDEHVDGNACLVQSPKDVQCVMVEAGERPRREEQVYDDTVRHLVLGWHVADTSKGFRDRLIRSIPA